MTIAKSIETLERRKAYLSKRIRKAKTEGKDLSFDRQECAALKRATKLMREYLDNKLDDDEGVRGPCLGKQVFGEYWQDDVALTEEERKMLSY